MSAQRKGGTLLGSEPLGINRKHTPGLKTKGVPPECPTSTVLSRQVINKLNYTRKSFADSAYLEACSQVLGD